MKKPIINIKNLHKRILSKNDTMTFENVDFSAGDISNMEVEEMNFEQCMMQNVEINQTYVRECKILDCILTKCNFVGTKIDKPYFERVTISNSRLQGTQLLAPIIKETYFKACKAVSAGFRYGKIVNSVFEDCDLTESDFMGITLEKVIFKNCILRGTQFSNAKLKQVSLKGSDIEDIRIEKDSFSEVIVDTGQAIYLASIFGLRVQD